MDKICKNCFYYEPDYGIFCANGWSQDGSAGYCLFMPKEVKKEASSKCSNFRPKFLKKTS